MFSHLTNYMGYGSSPDALEPAAILLELKTGVENCSDPLEPLDKFLQNFVHCQLQMLCPMLIYTFCRQHCVKSLRIRSFSRIRTEYGPENADNFHAVHITQELQL